MADNDLILNFGKHAGKRLSQVPPDYISWLAEQDIRKQPEARAAAQAWLQEHPAVAQQPRRSQAPGPKPRTYREASKLGWMAQRNYGNAKATLLAARDQDGFLMVTDEEDDEEYYHLLWIAPDGRVCDARTGFAGLSYEQVKAVLARYPLVDGADYLVEAAEEERRQADEARRTLRFSSRDSKSHITLIVWSADVIDVLIDGHEMGEYCFREPSAQERRHPQWKQAAAVLEPLDHPGNPIGLTLERATLVENKIAEVAKKEKE